MKRLACIAIACVCFGCPAAPNDDDPKVGGESHFLTCEVASDCAVGDCVCGVCAELCADGGCAAGQVCVAADSACPASLCAPESTCEADGCPSGLVCQDSVCRKPGQFLCGGTVEVESLAEGTEYYRGRLPEALEDTCALAGLDGPFCDAEFGAIYAIFAGGDDGDAVWCVDTDAARVAAGGSGVVLAGKSELGLAQGRHALVDGAIDGPRVVVVGAGHALTTLTGALSCEGSQARVVGLTLDGDVHVTPSANGVALIDVVITGDLVVEANNFALLNSRVEGEVRIEGNNASLVASEFVSRPELLEAPALCVGSHEVSEGSQGPSVCP